MLRFLTCLGALLLLFAAPAARAQGGGFDLTGPDLSIVVQRGDERLPITAVPAIRGGDRLTVRTHLPPDQSARYRLVLAFLRGATNPPPKDWFFEAETWRPKKSVLNVTVPGGAEQAVLLLVPDAGGGFDAVRGAVRGRPGIFVRAAQDLYQASLDRARLDRFVDGIARINDTAPERLSTVAPVLANTLRIKLNTECLSRARALQAACLTQNRENLVLQAQRGATLTETLTGTPVDLAYRVAATREAGGGYYSPYIGLARDLARLFGAFRSTQYGYLPALTLGREERWRLSLNAAPSFQNPRSVLVAALPPIGDVPLPVWRPAGAKPACLARPGLVLPLDDASALFATDYARDLTLRVTTADGGSIDLPVRPDAEGGGIRIGVDRLGSLRGQVTGGVLHGRWGFDTFTGPRLAVQFDPAALWTADHDGVVVVGRDFPLTLHGGAAACVTGMTLKGAGDDRVLTWTTPSAQEIATTLPLGRARAGSPTLIVEQHGAAKPTTVQLTAQVEASRLDRFTIHDGDRRGILVGTRLDQVASLDLDGRRFTAGTITRTAVGDRLELTTDSAVTGGQTPPASGARVRMRDGRVASVEAVIAEPRVRITVIDREIDYDRPSGSLPIVLPDGLVPASATLTFSIQTSSTATAGDDIEIAADDGAGSARLTVASGKVQRVGPNVLIATIDPRALLGPGTSGTLRIRLWRGDVAGDWQTLARLVRLPTLQRIDCPATGDCTLTGRDLFTVAEIGDVARPTAARVLPTGFVGSTLSLPKPAGGELFLRLHDAPDMPVRVGLPGNE